MFRVLAISDIHAQFDDLEGIVDRVSALNLKFDMVIIAGDLSANTHVYPASENPRIISKIVEILDVIAPIYGVLGNDDDPSTDLEQYGIHSLEQTAISVGKWTFVGWGGAPTSVTIPAPPGIINAAPRLRELDGIHLWKDETVIPALTPALEKIPKTQNLCMVTHYHPDAVFPSRGRYPLLGSKGLRAVLMRYQPKIWICGHIHPQVGYKKWFKPTQTLLIRVTCVKSDFDKYTNNPFGKVYWIVELEDDGRINTSYQMLAEATPSELENLGET